MFQTKVYKAYKQYWEDHSGCMGKRIWKKNKILKLTISTDFDNHIKELQFSDHSLKKENGKHTLRVKIPCNSNNIEDFKLTSLELLGIQENWTTDIPLDNSHCSHN
tara:strand:- start:129 stop:446 length:318 start_codon:yes stop_codon:yes gene_type:complete